MYTIFINTLRLLPAKEKRLFFLFVLAGVFISLFEIALLTGLVAFTGYYLNQGSASHFYFAQLLSLYNTTAVATGMLLLFIGKAAAANVINTARHYFEYAVATRLSENNIQLFLNGTYRQYTQTDAAVYIKHISQQPVEFAHYVLSGWQQLITQVLLLIITLGVLAMYKPMVFLLLLLLLLPPLFIARYIAKRKTAAAKTVIKTAGEETLQRLKEALAGFIESNVYGRAPFFSERYVSKQRLLNKNLAQLQTVQAAPAPMMEVFAVAAFVLLIVISENTGTTISFFTIGALMAAAYKIIPGVAKIINHLTLIKTYAYTVEQSTADKNIYARTTTDKLTAIECRNLCFDYVQPVLKQFNATITAGDFVGISAPSGFGKTTLINLLLGFEAETEGTLLFNLVAVSPLQRQQYWPQVAYVKQQPFLLYDTLEKNITLSNQAADALLLEEAVRVSGIGDWLIGTGGSLQTVITENGKNISGGQRQRIAIARALYKNAPVIILDEPFSELDAASEQQLLAYFKGQAQLGKIVILVTHNSRSLAYCTKIVHLNDQQ